MMPKAKAKSSRVESDDNYAATQHGTQAGTSSQFHRQLASLSEDDKQAKVNDLVRFLLIQDQKKIPIKKQDITKHVLHDHSKLFSLFMDAAEEQLKEVFGIKVVEVEKQRQKTYILVSFLENSVNNPHQTWSDDDNSKLALIMVILSTIFMNGNAIQDKDLFHTLRKLGVDVDQAHDTFGDVKKLLTVELVRQGWLEYQRQSKADPPVYEFSWGARAKAETSKRTCLDFVCQVYKNDPPDWVSQYQDVGRSEQQAAEEAAEADV